MFFYPSVHREIARQRHQDMLAKGERHRIKQAALAGKQENRRRPLIEPPALHEPSPTMTARRPQGAKA